MVLLFGSTTGDNNGGEAWSVTSPLSLWWSGATGASSSNNRNAGMAAAVLTDSGGTSTGTFPISNLTGQSANASYAAVTIAVRPK